MQQAAHLLGCSVTTHCAQAGQPYRFMSGLPLQIELRQQAVEAGIPHYLVVDAGRTQIAAGSRTGGLAILYMLSANHLLPNF